MTKSRDALNILFPVGALLPPSLPEAYADNPNEMITEGASGRKRRHSRSRSRALTPRCRAIGLGLNLVWAVDVDLVSILSSQLIDHSPTSPLWTSSLRNMFSLAT